jgi:glutamyl-tRNA synthetase
LTFKFTRGGIKLNPQKLDHFQFEYRNLLLQKTEKRTPLEQDLIRDNLLIPLIAEIHSITTDASSTILPGGTAIPWAQPLTLVPAMLSSPAEQQTYTLQVVSSEATRYKSVAHLARRLPYFFWRPPPIAYRGALASKPVSRALFDIIDKTIHESPDWNCALDRLLETILPGDHPEFHSLLRLIVVGSPEAWAKTSRVLFSILGQQEWQARTSIVRGLWDELENGGPEVRQRWLDEAQNSPSKLDESKE